MHDDYSSRRQAKVVLIVRKSCKFIQKLRQQQPYRTEVEAFRLLQFLELECKPNIAMLNYRIVYIFP